MPASKIDSSKVFGATIAILFVLIVMWPDDWFDELVSFAALGVIALLIIWLDPLERRNRRREREKGKG